MLRCSVVSELPWKADKVNFSSPEWTAEIHWGCLVASAVVHSLASALERDKGKSTIGL